MDVSHAAAVAHEGAALGGVSRALRSTQEPCELTQHIHWLQSHRGVMCAFLIGHAWCAIIGPLICEVLLFH